METPPPLLRFPGQLLFPADANGCRDRRRLPEPVRSRTSFPGGPRSEPASARRIRAAAAVPEFLDAAFSIPPRWSAETGRAQVERRGVVRKWPFPLPAATGCPFRGL